MSVCWSLANRSKGWRGRSSNAKTRMKTVRTRLCNLNAREINGENRSPPSDTDAKDAAVNRQFGDQSVHRSSDCNHNNTVRSMSFEMFASSAFKALL